MIAGARSLSCNPNPVRDTEPMSEPAEPRTVKRVTTAHRQYEGGGFPVRRPLPSQGLEMVDPFLLLDEMGPVDWAPGAAIGAPDHPHRGFETVTYLLAGEVAHADSQGGRGLLGPGDVQWMTAGSGVVHSELPSERVMRQGGRAHGFQVWVNLPAASKLVAPRYQEVPSERMPTASAGGATVKVIAGEALGVSAVVDTHTPLLFQHWSLTPGARVTQPIPAGFNALAYVFSGDATLGEPGQLVYDGQLAVLGPGDSLTMAGEAPEGAELLLLAGEPIREAVVRYGPFVMNTMDEIVEAFEAYKAGEFGWIEHG